MGDSPEVFGFKVKVHFVVPCPLRGETVVYCNVTEVHYEYREGMTAFESDIHGTGTTWPTDYIAEFEVTPETEIQEAF